MSLFRKSKPAEPKRKVSDTVTAKEKLALIVDDDESMRELTELALSNAGFKVVTAKNGSEALDRLKSLQNVSVIILDVQMPIMTGNEVLDEMRIGGFLDKVPVIILSASGHVNEYHEVFKIMTKPVSMEYLIQTVNESMEKFNEMPLN